MYKVTSKEGDLRAKEERSEGARRGNGRKYASPSVTWPKAHENDVSARS